MPKILICAGCRLSVAVPIVVGIFAFPFTLPGTPIGTDHEPAADTEAAAVGDIFRHRPETRIVRDHSLPRQPVVLVEMQQIFDEHLMQVAQFMHLRALHLSGANLTDEGLGHVERLPNLEDLDVSDTFISDKGLGRLAAFPALTRLDISETLITEAGLAALASVPRLRALTICGAPDRQHAKANKSLRFSDGRRQEGPVFYPTDATLRIISQLKHIEELSIRHAQVTPAGIAELSALPRLRKLELAGEEITDNSLRAVANSPVLAELQLGGTRITDSGLRHLQKLKHLRSLTIACPPEDGPPVTFSDDKIQITVSVHTAGFTKDSFRVTDATAVELAHFTDLTILHLPNACITDAGVKSLAALTRLDDLSLRGARHITDAGVEELAALSGLTNLDLCNVNMTDAGIRCLAGLQRLIFLDLTSAQFSDAGFTELGRLQCLKRLILQNVPIGTGGAAALERLSQLESLDLYTGGRMVTDATLEHVKALQRLRHLNLNLSGVTDAGLDNLRSLTRLESLNLESTEVTDAGLRKLAALVNLEDLNLTATAVTKNGLEALRQRLPKTRIHKDHEN